MNGIKNNELVVHHNYLNESKFVDFTELELNLFITILYKMRQEKDNEVIFKSEDIKSLTNAKDRSYKEFERIICSLQDRTFYLKTLDGYERIKPFPTLIFNNEKKEITVEINKRMIPVFKELKEQFTQYSLKEFVSLDNKYGKRLYQLLKQYEGIGKRNFKLDIFRELLDCTSKSYDKMSNLDKKVLMKARDDINKKTSLSVDYIKLKKGRKVESVEFTIHKKEETTLSDNKDTPSDKLSTIEVGSIEASKIKGKEGEKKIKTKVTTHSKITSSDNKDTPSDKLEKSIVKAKRNIYVSKAWNKRAETKILKLLRENGEDYTLDILNRLYVSVKQDIKTTLVQYINGIMKNIREEGTSPTPDVANIKIDDNQSLILNAIKTGKPIEVISNNLLPKEEKKKMTFEEFKKLDVKIREQLEKEAIELTVKKEKIPEKFLLDLKKKSLKIYFNTIKVNIGVE